jgi:pimeloyl-ACP methyl ester carboxylesterase
MKLWPVLAAAMMLSACSGLTESAAIDRLKPCKASEGPTDAYCGTLDVWEDRQAKTGRKIALKIVILPAMKQQFAPDPLFFLAGGPGQGAAQLAGQLRDPYRTIQADRDIVLVDQRGTGKSNPLDCKAATEERDDEDQDDPYRFIARLRTCLDSYKNKADVTKYTTSIAMDDLDDVREFLGYSKINLYGGSYGTRAAIVYLKRHADNVRSVILDGVAPTDMRLPLYMARDSQRALDLLFRDCERDKGCNQRFPNLRHRLPALLDRLGAKPQRVKIVHPRTGLEKELDVKRLTIGGILFATLYSPTTASLVPLLIEQAEKGNYGSFYAFGAAFDPAAANMAQGMHFSVVCSEDAPRIEAGSIAREAAGTFAGAEMLDLRLQPCSFWPRAQVDPSYFETPSSDVPALILSGELDPVTPPSWGEDVAKRLKNSRHIVVPATGHGAWGTGCVMRLMSQFLNEGSAAKLDSACVQQVKRPPFFLGPSGPDPMGGAGK